MKKVYMRSLAIALLLLFPNWVMAQDIKTKISKNIEAYSTGYLRAGIGGNEDEKALVSSGEDDDDLSFGVQLETWW